jgi:microcystin-dependent protein
MAEVYLGQIIMFAGNFAITGYQFCSGQTLSISQYTAVFAILGTTYGGNGTTTFQLPDLRGRVPVGQGQGPGLSGYVLGQSGGTENVTLLQTQMPAHTHAVNAYGSGADKSTVSGSLLANGAKPDYYSDQGANATMNPGMIAAAGGGQPFSIRQPYLSISYLIALVGIFPSRN